MTVEAEALLFLKESESLFALQARNIRAGKSNLKEIIYKKEELAEELRDRDVSGMVAVLGLLFKSEDTDPTYEVYATAKITSSKTRPGDRIAYLLEEVESVPEKAWTQKQDTLFSGNIVTLEFNS